MLGTEIVGGVAAAVVIGVAMTGGDAVNEQESQMDTLEGLLFVPEGCGTGVTGGGAGAGGGVSWGVATRVAIREPIPLGGGREEGN